MKHNISIKHKIIMILTLVLLIFNSVIPAYASVDTLIASNAVAIEANTGDILFSKNHNEKMYPASTTKVWTAYLTIKYSTNLDNIVEIKNDLSWVEPSSMFLKVGEKFTVRELLNVLMLKSANDVAVALAEYISGSVEEFAKLMNEEAKAIGCKNTNFVNPNGLPDENHYSTAYDMALIAKEAIKSDVLREIANTKTITLPGNEIYPHTRTYKNTNKFLTGGGTINYNDEVIDIKYDIVNGLKTGYTSAAGRCLLSTATVGDTDIIVGVFNSKGDNVYLDSREIIDYCFNRYQSKVIIDKDNLNAIKNLFFNRSELKGYIKENYMVTEDKYSRNSNSHSYDYDVTFSKDIKLPIEKDQVIGQVNVIKDGEVVDNIDLLSTEKVEKSFVGVILKLILLLIVILSVIIIGYCYFYIKSKKKKQSEKEYTINNRRR